MTNFNRKSISKPEPNSEQPLRDAGLEARLERFSDSFDKDEGTFTASTLRKLQELKHQPQRPRFRPIVSGLAVICAALVLTVFLQPTNNVHVSSSIPNAETVSSLNTPSASQYLQTMPLHTDATAEFLRTGTL